MYKKFMLGFVVFGLLSVLLAACAIRDASVAAAGPKVHMGATNFLTNTVKVPKGQSVNLIDDGAFTHIITNGTWQGSSTQKPGTGNDKGSGAPKANITFNGNDSSAIGPFTSAGTFEYYCTIHGGMNLTVTVS